MSGLQIYYDSFPPKLDRVAWIEVGGDRHYNTNFTEDINKCTIHSCKLEKGDKIAWLN